MYRLALRITLNSQEAEDVVQDVIIKAWQMREELENVDNLEAYLMRMTRNLAVDRQRMKVNNSLNIEGKDFAEVSSVEDEIDRNEQLESIRAIMQQLPEKQRTAMQLRDFEGKSYKEVADIMQITEDQVKVNIFRARKYIKDILNS